jgi:hypothetical protein
MADATEVIRWYQHQIAVKLMRALSRDELEEELAAEGFPKDSDGSAKVSLLGMDRSLAAWAILREHFPDQGDAILDLADYTWAWRRVDYDIKDVQERMLKDNLPERHITRLSAGW